MKNILFVVFYFILTIIISAQSISNIVLKNGKNFNSEIAHVFTTAIMLDSANSNRIVMYSVIDSIITADKNVALNIQNENPSIALKNSEKFIVLDFTEYSSFYPSFSDTNYYNKYYQFNLLLSTPKLYNISLLNYLGRKQKSNISVGFELWRSLSKSIMTGLGLKYTQMDYSFTQNNMDNEVDWKNNIITVTGIVEKKIYELSRFEFKVKLGMGLCFSKQNYKNLAAIEDGLLNYSGIGIFVELTPILNYSYENYNIFAGVGYNWAGFNYIFFNKKNKTSSRYLPNNYDATNIELGIGYKL